MKQKYAAVSGLVILDEMVPVEDRGKRVYMVKVCPYHGVPVVVSGNYEKRCGNRLTCIVQEEAQTPFSWRDIRCRCHLAAVVDSNNVSECESY